MTQRQIKLVENYVRMKVKKVLAEKKKLKEATYEDPGYGDNSHDAFKQYMTWYKQFGDIARTLTSATGYWYVGSGQQEIAEKIKSMNPEQLKEFRNQMAQLLLKSRSAQKIMNDVKITAQKMIESLN